MRRPLYGERAPCTEIFNRGSALVHRRILLMCHCEAPKGPWQSREGTCSLYKLLLKRCAPIASVAALPERHWQLQILKQFRRPCRFPDLSLRGPEGAVAISCRQLRFRRGFPVIQPGTARFPRRFAPRNDTSGGCSGAPEHLRG